MQDVIFFENYSPEESLQILLSKLKEHKLKLAKPGDEATEAAIKSGLLKAVTKLASDPNYANGRTMRNFATHILRRLAVRLADQKIDENDLIIVEGDFAGFKDSGAILDSLAKFSGEMAEGDSIGFIKD